jgi:glycosyltransferase involved in cell wall biosynthesis
LSLRITQLNLAYDETLAAPRALLDRYHTLTDFSAALSRGGASVNVIQRFAHPGTDERDGVAYQFLSDDGLPMPSPSWQSRTVVDAVLARRPHVIHVNGLMFPAIVGALRASATDIPVIVQDHSGTAAPGFIDSFRDGSWRGLRDANAWSFTAAEYAEPWRRAGLLAGSARVFEIVEASTTLAPVARREARRRIGLTGDPLILWVGRLNANKDPLTVLRGLDLAFERMAGARCCMLYTDSALEGKVRSTIDRSSRLRDRVTLVGSVPHSDMPLYFSAAELFVSGSRREGSGYALIEAMACGVIPVVTDIPSFRVIGGDCGLRWQPGNASSLSHALESVVRVDQALESARVRERFVLELSWDAIASRTLAAYRALVA